MLRRLWGPALLAPILLLCYRGGLGRDFTSEDFLILRRLSLAPFFERAAESFTGPWLGATFVPFYRPFSSLLLQLELQLFGAHPLPFLLLQLTLHAAIATLFAAWLGRLTGAPGGRDTRRDTFFAALLFALYPLHPNTVLFVASFATLFATFFLLASLYFEARQQRGAALLAAALALLSYEQAVVLPALILLFDLATRGGSWRSRWRLWPYFALTAAYLLLRSALLGNLGGYDGFRQRLADPLALASSFGELASRLFVPFFAIPFRAGWALAVAAVLAAATAAAIYWRREPGARLLLAALAALPLVQAPFFFTGVVPGNGRYFYLAALLVAIVVSEGLRLLWRRQPRLLAPSLAAVALVFAYGLTAVVAVYGEAGERCRAIRERLEAAPPGRLFLAGRPLFAYRWGAPVAQIFHWGLADAAQPPFTERRDLELYPLPELAEGDFAPLLQRPELGRVARLGAGDRLEMVTPPASFPARLAAVEEAGAGASRRLRLAAPPAGQRLRLIVLCQGGPSVLDLPAGPAGVPAEVLAEVPAATRDGMFHLYHAPIFFWVEARDGEGRLLATTDLVELPPPPPASISSAP